MTERPIVTDLVLRTLEASAIAISDHYFKLFSSRHDQSELARHLASGSIEDLEDNLDPRNQSSGGYSHLATSTIFRDRLADIFRILGPGLDLHIREADYDRGIYSLIPTGRAATDPSQDALRSRTRISAILQQALRRCRRTLQPSKVVASSDTPSVFVPSPFYVARQVLTNPAAPATEAYAVAAIRTELSRYVELSSGRFDITHESMSKALAVIENRSRTSKSIFMDDAVANFVCHYLAAKGILVLELEAQSPTPLASGFVELFSNLSNLFITGKDRRALPLRLGFRLHPDHASLPNAGELLNELKGLPLPIEGAGAIFYGGLRFASRGDVVAAVSGPFGAGKTSACLSLAAALAPVGCRTLYLCCEEASQDIESRLGEATPDYIIRSSPLFRCIAAEELQLTPPDATWFSAHRLRISANGEEGTPIKLDVSAELRRVLDEAIESAPIFAPFREKNSDWPPFARPIVIIDGFHQLFRESDIAPEALERSLRELIDRCRELRAIVIFTVAAGGPEMERLDYLCDLVIELNREGTDRPDEATHRVFKLLKARRQPAMHGAHLFHITSPKSFRIKPNVEAQGRASKSLRWVERDPAVRIPLESERGGLAVQLNSQILVYGTGSSGKAGFGLFVLNRRPISVSRPQDADDEDLFQRDSVEPLSHEDHRRPHEPRTLVISFLYQEGYYRDLQKRLRSRRPRMERTEIANLAPARDRAIIDVISLYPGALTAEDLLFRVESQLTAAELRGIPYTGVLVDGIHNVFVQFPAIEANVAFWPQLYSLLRRRSVTVVTTHTEFELREKSLFRDRRAPSGTLSVDFEHAQRKAAPLLSVLVSAADYVFELSGHEQPDLKMAYHLEVLGMLGEDPPRGFATWDRQRCRLGKWQSDLSLWVAP